MKLEAEYLFTEKKMTPLIRSVSYNQDTILQSIIYLHIPAGKIQVDPCFGRGGFYRTGKIEIPAYCFDIEPARPGVLEADCRELPFENNSINNLIFDPPWLTYPGKNRCKKLKHYGFFKNEKTLRKMYRESFSEFFRILKKNGVLIVKCQDGTFGPDISLHHIDAVVLPCRQIGFKVIDLFVLLSKQRIEKRTFIQRHSRKYHCYFLVFKKKGNTSL